MKKGALARIDVARPLEAGGGTLRWLVPPDLLVFRHHQGPDGQGSDRSGADANARDR